MPASSPSGAPASSLTDVKMAGSAAVPSTCSSPATLIEVVRPRILTTAPGATTSVEPAGTVTSPSTTSVPSQTVMSGISPETRGGVSVKRPVKGPGSGAPSCVRISVPRRRM
ncbi:MAG: hypothetical protein BWZ02_03141 [Lentisphaerae bacterium ADurb.BinA184]|nr:MAG: hypothetical protein BWZ02_03141 [Lentisphaerae bacterium ADurb.BinA184]